MKDVTETLCPARLLEATLPRKTGKGAEVTKRKRERSRYLWRQILIWIRIGFFAKKKTKLKL